MLYDNQDNTIPWITDTNNNYLSGIHKYLWALNQTTLEKF